jgi:hypothetical protein
MSNLLEKIQNDALSLSEQERVFLADRLLSSPVMMRSQRSIRPASRRLSAAIRTINRVSGQASLQRTYLPKLILF